ncbi:MAG: coproporphyrinogen dehydrogenase HemZ [Lachnospiraceae bacterium]|nr:coproporphyrinogen dehydrogenase HemZ [Lachnospiraceae bacterium]
MITIITGKLNNLEYDVLALASAFYPGREIVFKETDKEAPLGEVIYLEKIIDETAPKNEQRRQFYRYLSEQTGRQLPWGVLTGVRPTKLTTAAIRGGMTPIQAADMMKKEYLVSAEKAVLAAEIAAREAELFAEEKETAGALPTLPRKSGLNLYIGIAFCPTTCLYCSFTSFSIEKWGHRVDDYLKALFREIDWTAKKFAGEKLNTLYIGGGTPTSLSAEQLERLLAKIRGSFDLSNIREFTVEAGRPDSIDREKMIILKKYGVDRISINPQTMNDKTLRLIGRNHSAAQVSEKFALARKAGFDNINMDIILGLPEETAEDVAETISQIQKLRPESLTVHALAVKRASRLKMESEGVPMPGPSADEAEKMMYIAAEGAASMGLRPYYMYRQKNMAGNLENVGYAAPGREGIYNIIIIEETQSIVALGAGTVSKRVFPDGHIDRCDCVKNIEQYIARVDEMIDRKKKLFE